MLYPIELRVPIQGTNLAQRSADDLRLVYQRSSKDVEDSAAWDKTNCGAAMGKSNGGEGFLLALRWRPCQKRHAYVGASHEAIGQTSVLASSGQRLYGVRSPFGRRRIRTGRRSAFCRA